MSIKIEITASSITELADKLLALGSSLSGQVHAPVEVPTEAKPKRQRKPVDVVAEEAPAEQEAPVQEAAEPVQEVLPKLDFDKDVAPVVIGAVGKIGKPAVSGILEQFGAGRASEVAEDRWPELLVALNDALDI